MKNRVCIVTEWHVNTARRTVLNNPIARAIRQELGFYRVAFDGSDTFQYQPIKGADWHLTTSPEMARIWLRHWFENRAPKIPFRFLVNA